MKIYIDADYKCHTEPAEGRREIETDNFNGKCKPYIEGYRYIPQGETWTRDDGEQFRGEMISPWRNYSLLEEFQEQDNAHAEELFNLIEEVYNADLNIIG